MKPTVGRTVYFYESAAHRQACDEGRDQPYIAFVTFVHNEQSINLLAISHHNVPHPHLGVSFQGLGDPIPTGAHAAWMPYQVSRASTDAQKAGDAQIDSTAAQVQSLAPAAPSIGTDAAGLMTKALAEPEAPAAAPAPAPAAAPVVSESSDTAASAPADTGTNSVNPVA